MKTKLIISPHVDDETLGCGGIINKNFFVLHCGLAEIQRHGDFFFSREQREEEFETVKKENRT